MTFKRAASSTGHGQTYAHIFPSAIEQRNTAPGFPHRITIHVSFFFLPGDAVNIHTKQPNKGIYRVNF